MTGTKTHTYETVISANISDFNLETSLSKISFCDKQCSNVNDNGFKSAITSHLTTKYGINVLERQFMMLNPNTLKNIAYNPHVIAPITRGTPYILFLTCINGINCAFFIDRKVKNTFTYPKIHCVKYRFDNSLYENDTVFTGELILDNERRWCFMLDNILVYKGEHLGGHGGSAKRLNVISRYELIHKIMSDEYVHDKYIEICPIIVKRLFNYSEINKMLNDFIPSLSYACKGIIFYTISVTHSNYAYFFEESPIPITTDIIDIEIQEKRPDLWKKLNERTHTHTHDDDNNNNDETVTTTTATEELPQTDTQTEEQLTISHDNAIFKIMKTNMPDIYNLYTVDGGQNNKHSIALIPTLALSKYLNKLFNTAPTKLDFNIICKYSRHFQRWCPTTVINSPTAEPYTSAQVADAETHILSTTNQPSTVVL